MQSVPTIRQWLKWMEVYQSLFKRLLTKFTRLRWILGITELIFEILNLTIAIGTKLIKMNANNELCKSFDYLTLQPLFKLT